ncbi:MAG: Maf family protein, partial [Reyranella sp.]|nr:Maf family protein [Reyranella sp.]
TMEEASECLRVLSGRSHRVFTAVTMLTPSGQMRKRLVETRIRFKRLSADEIEAYIASREWRDKAGGYAIQGRAARFVDFLSGSYSNVVGLPLFETVQLLKSAMP